MFKAASRPPAGRFASLARWLRARARRVEGRAASRLGIGEAGAADVLDLLDQVVYTGEVTPDGEYIETSASPFDPFSGGPVPEGIAPAEFWESLVHPDDRAIYAGLNRDLLRGEDCEATYRLLGVDGVTRILRDRARPRPRRGGGVLLRGIISDVTAREEADARLAEASDRFTRLLDVVGEHVYMAQALPDGTHPGALPGPGRGPAARRRREPDRRRWRTGRRRCIRTTASAYDAFNRTLAAGEDADVEYRLIGADGITRWVHDRAARRRRPDGTIEISGIVSDVTERRRMRAELDGGARRAVARRRGDGRSPLHAPGRGGRRLPHRLPRPPSRRAGRRARSPAARRTTASGSRSCTPTTASAGGRRSRASATGSRSSSSTACVGLDGAERIVLDRLRPRRERGRNAVLRRRHARRHRAPAAGGRAAARAHGAAELRARTDELTGAFNRRHFAEIVAEALATDPTAARCCCSTPTTSSRSTTCTAMSSATPCWSSSRAGSTAGLGPDDCLARWGGEEFAVLLRGVGSDAELDRLAERLRAAVARHAGRRRRRRASG